MRHVLGKHSPNIQNAIPVAETNIGFVTLDCLCEIVEKIQKMNIGFVTSDWYTKSYRNRTEHEHMVCNLRFVPEIFQKSYLKGT